MAEDSRPSSSRRTAEFAKRYRLSGGCGVGSGGCGPLPLRFGGLTHRENFESLYSKLCILVHFNGFQLLCFGGPVA